MRDDLRQNLEIFNQLIAKGKQTKNTAQKTLLKDELFTFYDSLPEILPNEMLGHWKGGSWKVGTPLDGLLELGQWYGKIFHTINHVDAVVHKFRFFSVVGFLGTLLYFPWKIWTEQQKYRMPATKACLREIHYRGKTSSSMVYYYLPIIDHFRKIDQNTIVGIMDMKGKAKYEFFFYLQKIK